MLSYFRLIRPAQWIKNVFVFAALAFGKKLGDLEAIRLSLLAFAAFTLTAIVAGHLLGGPDPANRSSLAVSCASRHIGLGLLIAAHARGPHTLSLVVAYLLASTVVSIPYIMWTKKHRDQA